MIRPLTTLKSWFETGDKPTQAQFWDWLDSFFHKEEQLPISSVQGLSTALNSKADAAALDALMPDVVTGTSPTMEFGQNGGFIFHKFRVKSTSAMPDFKIGTVPGGGQIYQDTIAANTATIVTLDYDLQDPSVLFFSGLAGNWQIKIILQ